MHKTTADPARPEGDETRAALWIDSLAHAWQSAEERGKVDWDEQAYWVENRDEEMWMKWDIDHGDGNRRIVGTEAIPRRAREARDPAEGAKSTHPAVQTTGDAGLAVPAGPRAGEPRDAPSSGGRPWRPRLSVPPRPFEPRGRSLDYPDSRGVIAVFMLLLLANSLLWFAAGLSIVAGAGPVGEPHLILTTITFLLGMVAGGLAATFFVNGKTPVEARPAFSLIAEARLERLCAGRAYGRSRGVHRGR
jgi:hypothetical protein